MDVYVLSQTKKCDDHEYWGFETAQLIVGVTTSRQQASEWFGSEIEPGTVDVAHLGTGKSVTKTVMLPS